METIKIIKLISQGEIEYLIITEKEENTFEILNTFKTQHLLEEYMMFLEIAKKDYYKNQGIKG